MNRSRAISKQKSNRMMLRPDKCKLLAWATWHIITPMVGVGMTIFIGITAVSLRCMNQWTGPKKAPYILYIRKHHQILWCMPSLSTTGLMVRAETHTLLQLLEGSFRLWTIVTNTETTLRRVSDRMKEFRWRIRPKDQSSPLRRDSMPVNLMALKTQKYSEVDFSLNPLLTPRKWKKFSNQLWIELPVLNHKKTTLMFSMILKPLSQESLLRSNVLCLLTKEILTGNYLHLSIYALRSMAMDSSPRHWNKRQGLTIRISSAWTKAIWSLGEINLRRINHSIEL